MISRIAGTIVDSNENSLILKQGNICYEIQLPLAVMKAIEKENPSDGEVELITYHYYQMDQSKAIPVLIGFNNLVEREFFEKFISVSGVGPRAACRALAKPFSEIAEAIDREDTGFLKGLPGIGDQRARLIIAKLQGKVGKYCLIKDKQLSADTKGYSDISQDALSVLLQLQYKKNEAEDMINRALERNPDIKTGEELLNEVYRDRKISN